MSVFFSCPKAGYRQNDNAWDSGMQTAVQVQGTVNQRDDKDKSWTVEMRVPMAAVKGRMEAMKGVPPQVGSEWRANFFRLDHPYGKPQVGSSWSPPMLGDFHALDKFGTLVFADSDGKVAPSAPAPATAETPPPAAAPATPPAPTAPSAKAAGPHTLNPMLEQAMKGDDSPAQKPAPAEAKATSPAPAAPKAAGAPKSK